jgi:hypothetical protein
MYLQVHEALVPRQQKLSSISFFISLSIKADFLYLTLHPIVTQNQIGTQILDLTI